MTIKKYVTFLLSLILLGTLIGCSVPKTQQSLVTSPQESATPSIEPTSKPIEPTTDTQTLHSPNYEPFPECIITNETLLAQDRCIVSYINALKANDFNKMISLSMCDEIGPIITHKTGINYIGEAARIATSGSFAENTKHFIYSLLSPPEFFELIPDCPTEKVDEFIQAVDPAKLNDIKIIAMGTPKKLPVIPNFTPHIEQGGFEKELNYRYCLFSYDDNIFLQGFLLIKFNDTYRIADIGMPESETPGFSLQTTLQEFKDMIDMNTAHTPSDETLISCIVEDGTASLLSDLKNNLSFQSASPEDTLNRYVNAISNQDVYGALSTLSFRNRAQSYDLHIITESCRMFFDARTGEMPAEYPFYQDINMIRFAADDAEMLVMIPFLLLVDYENPPTESSPTMVLEILAQSNYDDISSFDVIRSDNFAITMEDKGIELGSKHAKQVGADDMQHRIVEYKIGNKKFIGGMTIYCFQNDWKIGEPHSAYLGISVLMVPSEKIDYDSNI